MENGSIQLLDPSEEKENFIVLVGAITGIEDLNEHEFNRAEHALKMVGYAVWNPISLHDSHGKEQPWEWYMRHTLSHVIWATGLAVVGDSRAAASRGCRRETMIGEWLNIPIKPWHQWMHEKQAEK